MLWEMQPGYEWLVDHVFLNNAQQPAVQGCASCDPSAPLWPPVHLNQMAHNEAAQGLAMQSIRCRQRVQRTMVDCLQWILRRR